MKKENKGDREGMKIKKIKNEIHKDQVKVKDKTTKKRRIKLARNKIKETFNRKYRRS